MNNDDIRESIKKYLANPEKGINKTISDFLQQQVTVFFIQIRRSHYWLYSKEEINSAYEHREKEFIPVNLLEDELYNNILELLFPRDKKASVLINLAKAENPAAYFQKVVFNTVFIAGVKKRNPEIVLLIKDIKDLIQQYSDVFIRIEKSGFEMNPHISLSSDFDRNFYESISFPGYLKTRTRLRKIFFAMVKCLEENDRIRMKDLISNIKTILGVVENKSESLVSETEENGDTGEIKLSNYALEKDRINYSDNIDYEERDLYEYMIRRFYSLCKPKQVHIYGTYIILLNDLTDYKNHNQVKLDSKKIISDYIARKYGIKKSRYHIKRTYCENLIVSIAINEKLTSDQFDKFTQFIKTRFENQIFIDEVLLDNFIKQNIKEKKAKRKKRNDR